MNLRSLFDVRWTAVIALALGVWMAPAGQTMWNAAAGYYDDANPVLKMTGRLERQDDDSVWIRVAGEKLRECSYIRVQTYTRNKGVLTDAFSRREDRPETGHTKPLGTYSIGMWRIWPKGDADTVLMYVQSACDGRLVMTLVAEVTL